MIKSIKLKHSDVIDGSTFKINFDPKRNIIIGPKGGGKSTLFNLIISFIKGFQGKHITDALNKYDLEPIEIEKDTGEIIKYSNLNKIKKDEFEHKANTWNDVVWQSDEVKYKLDDTKYINKEKKDFIKDLLDDNKSTENLINMLREIYNTITELRETKQRVINWDNILKFQTQEKEYNIIMNLHYSNNSYKIELQNKQQKDEELISKIWEYIKTINKISFENINKNNRFKSLEDWNRFINDLIIKNTELLKIIQQRSTYWSNSLQMLKSFMIALTETKNSIKKEKKEDALIAQFRTESTGYFKDHARLLKKIRNKFNNLKQERMSLTFNKRRLIGILELNIDVNLQINEDLRTNLLKIVLYTPGSTNSIENWILEQFKKDKQKDFQEQAIKSRIIKDILEYIKIMAGNKEYSALSSGEKSIYGIKFKMGKMNHKGEYLFLDQPEDNLDNKTIVKNLITDLKEFDGQSFFVTHNANIGILTGTKKVIVADIHKEDNKYKEGILAVDNDTKKSDAASFLEGGVDSLKTRYKIINKTKGESNEN